HTQVLAAKSSSRPKKFNCYKCEDLGHIAKNCLSEKVKTLKPQYKLVKQSNKEKEQNKNINLATVKSSEENEVYVMHLQPYTTDRKGARSKQKQSESRKEEAL
ncbi:17396_t:CDS:1, partial [Gigaspora margarita]